MQPANSLLRDLVRKRDFYAGGLMLLLGLGVALKGSTYRAGTLMHMGPGFLPARTPFGHARDALMGALTGPDGSYQVDALAALICSQSNGTRWSAARLVGNSGMRPTPSLEVKGRSGR